VIVKAANRPTEPGAVHSDMILAGFHTEYLMPYGAGVVMVLVSKLTAAIRANALPSSVVPVFSVIN
jgi:hypothetical protein